MIFSLYIATVVSLALLIGTEFAVSAFVNPILWKLDDVAQATAIRMFARKLGTVMPFWYVGSLVLLGCIWVLERHSGHAQLLMVAAVTLGRGDSFHPALSCSDQQPHGPARSRNHLLPNRGANTTSGMRCIAPGWPH